MIPSLHSPMASVPKTATFFISSLFLLLLLYPTTILSDIVSDRVALLAFRSSVGSHSKLWRNVDYNNPCSWAGVGCSPDNSTVLALRLPGTGLAGIIPPDTISSLTNLQTLSLRYNSLSGPFPSDLSKLLRLRNLYLRRNLFTGPLPDFLFNLTNLVRLDLSENGFSGSVSPNFINLTRLGTLNLQDNSFNGTLPDLSLLPNLVAFNVSNNHLTGPIPKGVAIKYPKDCFDGNSLCGEPLNDICDNGVKNQTTADGDDIAKKKKHRLSGGAIAGIVIGSVVALLILVIILWWLCTKRGRNRNENENQSARGLDNRVGVKEQHIEIPTQSAIHIEEKDGSGGESGSKERRNGSASSNDDLVFYKRGQGQEFSLEELLKGSAEVLGKGTLGASYRVLIESGVTVAVKRLRDVIVSEKEFKLKMDEIGKMDNQNLVSLVAYLYNTEEKLLVYEYMRLGSLSSLLHGNATAGRTTLNWETRLGIALGAAQGVSYLHSLGPLVSHGNIKSSNILITANYESRLSDYCLAQLVGPSAIPNRVAGYRAPEVSDLRNVSQEADIYSFGVLLFELLTGKAPTQELVNDERIDLSKWVHSVVREEWTSEVFDPELLKNQNVEEDMVQLLKLAMDCTAQEPGKRPLMSRVTTQIQNLYDLSLEDRTFDIKDE